MMAMEPSEPTEPLKFSGSHLLSIKTTRLMRTSPLWSKATQLQASRGYFAANAGRRDRRMMSIWIALSGRYRCVMKRLIHPALPGCLILVTGFRAELA